MVDDIFKDVDVSSLKFFVFNHASGEENVQTAVFGLLEVLV